MKAVNLRQTETAAIKSFRVAVHEEDVLLTKSCQLTSRAANQGHTIFHRPFAYALIDMLSSPESIQKA